MRSSSQIKTDIRRITALVVEDSEVANLRCSIDGTASGIPSAFIDAIDRADTSGLSSGALHELLVEFAQSIAAETNVPIPRNITVEFRSGEVGFTTE